MAHLYRLIAAVALIWVAAVSPAYALITPSEMWQGASGGAACLKSAPLEAIRCALEKQHSTTSFDNCSITSQTATNAVGRCRYVPNGNYLTAGATKAAGSCPANSSPSGSQCVCNSGYTEVNGACITANEDRQRCATFLAINRTLGGALTQDYRLEGNITNGAEYCMPGAFDSSSKGCKVQFERTAVLDYGGGNVITEGQLNGRADADTVDQSCTIGDNNKIPKQEKCKNGFTGVVNGVEVCVSKKPDNGVGDKTGETETDNGTEKRKVKTDSRTECSKGVCTTTTTVTTTITNNSTGASTTTINTSTTTQDKDGFCKENPGSKLCKSGDDDGSSFSGSCGGGFKCEGDAIQCAMAQEQHRRACQLFEDKPQEYDLYQQEKQYGKASVTGQLEGNKSIDIGASISAQDVFIGGGGACPADEIVALPLGGSFAIPYSRICPYLQIFGNVLVVIASITAVFLVIRRGS